MTIKRLNELAGELTLRFPGTTFHPVGYGKKARMMSVFARKADEFPAPAAALADLGFRVSNMTPAPADLGFLRQTFYLPASK